MKSREWLFGIFSSLAAVPAIAHQAEPPRSPSNSTDERLKTSAASPKISASNRPDEKSKPRL